MRNLERASIPRSVAMKMVGHKTESVYRRYAIVDEAMLRDAAEKLAAHRGQSPGQSGVVIIEPVSWKGAKNLEQESWKYVEILVLQSRVDSVILRWSVLE